MSIHTRGAILHLVPLPQRPSDVVENAAARLRAAREALGIQQQDMARACGSEPQRWNNWEAGRSLPDAVVLIRAHALYGISLDWVYAGDPRNLPGRLLDALRTRRPDLMPGASEAPTDLGAIDRRQA